MTHEEFEQAAQWNRKEQTAMPWGEALQQAHFQFCNESGDYEEVA